MQINVKPRPVRAVRVGGVLLTCAALGAVLLAACDSSTTAGKDVDSSTTQATRVSHGPAVAAQPKPASSVPAPSPAGPRTRSSRSRPRVSVPSSTNTGTLRSHLQGQKIAYVSDEGLKDAATYDQSGHIAFWILTQGGWIKRGSSTYPTPIAHDEPVTVHGYELAFPAHLTDGTGVEVYVVNGEFTTDGAANTAVFASGSNDWGALAVEHTLLMSTGAGATSTTTAELFYGAKLSPSADSIATSQCPSDKPLYQCGGANLTVTHWRWSNTFTGFVREH